jgi:tubulin monoglycylase TTLL15
MQEFVEDQFLIDGHAFDLGVYVLITSIDPLRIYKWKSDVFLRFCPEPYHPFDQKNVDKYVVSESHLPFWEIPSLAKITETLNVSALDAFNLHLKENGHDATAVWSQVDDAIVSITLSKAKQISRYAHLFRKSNKVEFFELLRFDFIIKEEKENLKLFLMEVWF